ncbi:Cnl2/NKP2 family protein-domain-containing protein [Pyronema omphalodes]|nr:Cnl2/NKP2 family protein-domain-containing protein [Pyronema omphalodes]
MPPTATETETRILTSFLLSRASLPDIITLSDFTLLFPRSHRSNPQIRLLYRTLQSQRNKQCQSIKSSIQRESSLGIKNPVTKPTPTELDPDAMVGIELFGAGVDAGVLPLKELLGEMEKALGEMEKEQEEEEKECERLLEGIRQTVGDLSDLKYGKLQASAAATKREVEGLLAVCQKVTGQKV